MSLVSLLIAIVVLGLVLYLVGQVLPISPPWLRTVALVLIILIFIGYLTGYLPGPARLR